MDVRDPARPVEPYDAPFERGLPPAPRYLRVTAQDLVPDVAAGRLATWVLVHSDQPEGDVVGLANFLRLPLTLRSLIAKYLVPGSRWTLLVTNGERLHDSYAEDLESTRRYVDAIQSRSIKLVVTAAGIEREDRVALDTVFRVDRGRSSDWREGLLSEEKGDARRGTAGVRPTRLGEVDEVVQTFEPLGVPRSAPGMRTGRALSGTRRT